MTNNPIFVALDLETAKQALEVAEQTGEFVGGFKVGPRLLFRSGPDLIRQLVKIKPVFVDHKFFDIPSVMVASVRSVFDAGASLTTVHAQAGRKALAELSNLERELNEQRDFQILSVTVLTSFDEKTISPVAQNLPIEEQVRLLAKESHEAGLSGLVCSGHEASHLRKEYPKSYILTPGIRLEEDAASDQSRVLTPKMAMAKGASALVVGRPIVKASNPRQAAKRYFDSL